MVNVRGNRPGGVGRTGPTSGSRLQPNGRSARTRTGGRQSRTRRLLVPFASVGVVVAVVVGLAISSLTSGGTEAAEAAAPATVVNQTTRLPSRVLTQVGESREATALIQTVAVTGL